MAMALPQYGAKRPCAPHDPQRRRSLPTAYGCQFGRGVNEQGRPYSGRVILNHQLGRRTVASVSST